MKTFILMALGFAVTFSDASAERLSALRWSPDNTRVVVISLARFAGEKDGATSFPIVGRLDDPLVELLIKRGVPEEQILYLKDQDATEEAIKEKLPAFLGKSTEDETLLFYYSSHGGYDPETGEHTFSAYDGKISIGWFVGNIEAWFEGRQAMLFSDCCFSGGLVELAEVRTDTHISFGALSTTGSANLGFSGWRFTDVLIRAWSGDVAMDLDESSTISFDELCIFAERYMAFVAEGKPLYVRTGDFDGDLVLSNADRPAKEGIGALIEARDDNKWYKAEVIDVKLDGAGDEEPAELHVHFTDKSRYSQRAWVTMDDIREYEYATYDEGEEVEIRNADGKWLPGKVIDSFEHMHECSYDGKSSLYNEWMSPSRIRPIR